MSYPWITSGLIPLPKVGVADTNFFPTGSMNFWPYELIINAVNMLVVAKTA